MKNKEHNNPIINFAHICDQAFLSQDGKLNIIGIFQNIQTKKLPFNYPKITCALNLNVTQKSVLKLQIVHGTNKELIAKMEGNITPKEDTLKHMEVGFMSDFQGIRFETAGLYHFEIWINGKLEKIIPFQIHHIKPKP
jgi:hypothetical protein